MTRLVDRRNVLKGTLGGAAITVGLPFLDCFLNNNGTALAAGQDLPVCFGTWYQGLGFDPGQWIPEKIGAGYTNKHQLRMFEPLKQKINIISGTKYFMDGRPLETHTSGYQISSTGALRAGVVYGASLDQIIADTIGKRTRFRSLEVSIGGGRRSFSKRVGPNTNPAETSPKALYTRIFGPEFVDPNAADFQPDPMVMARQSVLTAVKDERMALMQQVGAADRARLEQYFTSLRDIENQLAIEMQKPDPLPACVIPAESEAGGTGDSVVEAEKNGTIFGKLLANALACGQTRVINIVLGSNGLRKPGNPLSWHVLTHEEPVDDTLGYQREVGWFVEWANNRFYDFIKAMDEMKEGDHSVLDRTAILWQTDHGYARTHTMDDLATLIVGSAGGRLKTGLHIRAAGDPQTRVGLTMQQVMGVSINTWGGGSNQTSKTMTEILA